MRVVDRHAELVGLLAAQRSRKDERMTDRPGFVVLGFALHQPAAKRGSPVLEEIEADPRVAREGRRYGNGVPFRS